jgi:hypothetical protein
LIGDVSQQVDWVGQVAWVEQVGDRLEQPSNNLLNPSNLANPINL